MNSIIKEKLETLIKGFLPVLYQEDDPDYVSGKFGQGVEDREKYRYWEWTQGVGLFGLWKLFEKTKDERYLNMLTSYYDERIKFGLPGKNVNTMAPILALEYLGEYLGNEEYLKVSREWTEWLFEGGLPRTPEGGFQHRTTDDVNEGELWDDTLMMSVLPLANMGRIDKRQDYIEESEYQLLLHIEQLADTVTGLWYHGYTYKEKNHFAGAFWGRGNSWATIALPLFEEIIHLKPSLKHYVSTVLTRQVNTIGKLQDKSGLWHTLLDHEDSYLESSCTAGFGYGILLGIKLGLLDEKYKDIASKALPAILDAIDENGVLNLCSYGTPMGRESLDWYREIPIHPMPYGQAMAMLFLIEAMDADL